MNILLRSDGGPVEGFRSAAFRVAISDEGFGEIVALPEDLENVSGTVVASVDGADVFAWRVEDREAFAGDVDTVTVTGRGRLASLERAVVLPAGYPNFTTRTRTEQGPPFAVWADLLSEAQGRGRAVGLTPTWTASEDSQGQPWQEVVDFELEPGVTLADLLLEVAEVEGAEWIIRPDGSIDAARGLGVDRSSEVVLFVGHNQISRGRRESSRNQRQTVFLEASTGVSEVTNDYTDADAGEIWLEGQDFSDPLSRELVAEKLASKLAEPEVEVEVAVDPECGVFDRFNVGDVIGLDTGREGIEPVRVIGATVSVNEEGVEVELTLVSQVALRQQQIDRAIEAKADVKLAAGATLQRRHGLVTADKFLSGAVGDEVAISSENYIPGVQGWVITGDGDAEFNDATFRGDLQSDNYDPEVAGWRILSNGEAEFNDTVTVNGTINASDGTIGGFTIDADKLQGNLFLGEGEINGGLLAGCRLSGGSLQIGGAAGLNANTSDGMWVGDAQFGSAPFRVDLSGNLTLTAATLEGPSITGGVVRTSSAFPRVEMSAAQNGLDFFNASGKRVSRLFNPTTGPAAGDMVIAAVNASKIFLFADDSSSHIQVTSTNWSVSENGSLTLNRDISCRDVSPRNVVGSGSITASGNVGSGNGTVFTNNGAGSFNRSGAAAVFSNRSDAFSGNQFVLTVGRAGSAVGGIAFNPSPVSISLVLVSDESLKVDVEDDDGGLDRLKQLRPRRWGSSEKGAAIAPDGGRGFVAQEVEQVRPELVTTDENGLKYVSVVSSELVLDLIESVQEIDRRLIEMENR